MKSKKSPTTTAASRAASAPKPPTVRKPRAPKTAPTREFVNGHGNGEVSRDLIAVRAYQIFIEQGGQHGHDLEHWLAAERELASPGE